LPENFVYTIRFTPSTGSLFFAPSATFLENLGDQEPSTSESGSLPADPDRSSSLPVRNTSLGIASLKEVKDE
jgi:porphyrinogen peroxidase